MDRPIVPEYRDGTTSIKRPALDQGAIGHPTASNLGGVYLVPFCVSGLYREEQNYVPSIALLVAL
jgi:hypothetical protein